MMTTHLVRLFRALALLIAGMFVVCATTAAAATANCSVTGPSPITVPMPSTITLPRDGANGGAVGTVLTPWVTTARISNYYTCNIGGSAQIGTGIGGEALGLTKTNITVLRNGINYTVWQLNSGNTGLTGVGIAMGIFVNVAGCGWTPFPFDLGTPNAGTGFPGNACNQIGNGVIFGIQLDVALVKIGPISGGSFPGGTLADAFIVGQSATGGPYSQLSATHIPFIIGQTSFVVPTCTPTVSPNPVVLPIVKAADFAAATLVGPKPFTITLACPPSNPVNVLMTLTDARNSGNVSNDLKIAKSAGSASGVKIRIKRGDSSGADVVYGPDTVASNPAQFQVGTLSASGGNIVVPFTALYSRTGTAAAVTPGSVNGAASFTMSYQ